MNPSIHLTYQSNNTIPDVSTKEGMNIFLAVLRKNFLITKDKLPLIIREAEARINTILNHLKTTTHPLSNYLVELKGPGVLQIQWTDGNISSMITEGYVTTLDLNPTFDEWLDEEFEEARKRLNKHIENLYEKAKNDLR